MNIIIKSITIFLFVLTIDVHSNEYVPAIGNNTDSLIEAGNTHAKKGIYAQALEELNQAIAQDPSNPRAYKLRGHVFYAMGDYRKSLQDLNQVVVLVPSSTNAYCDRAIAHCMVGNHGLALVDIDYAIKLNPASRFAQAVRQTILDHASEK